MCTLQSQENIRPLLKLADLIQSLMCGFGIYHWASTLSNVHKLNCSFRAGHTHIVYLHHRGNSKEIHSMLISLQSSAFWPRHWPVAENKVEIMKGTFGINISTNNSFLCGPIIVSTTELWRTRLCRTFVFCMVLSPIMAPNSPETLSLLSVLGFLLCCSSTKVVWPLEQRRARFGLTVVAVNFLLGTVNWCGAGDQRKPAT